MQDADYTPEFFESHRKGAINSAEVVIPLAMEFIKPDSVIDVGCGMGAWLSVWEKQGVKDIMGIDGDYVDKASLMIAPSKFKAINLKNSFTLARKYTLVTCLEVAEHLPPASAESFIASLCRLGEVILFSAAIPGQEGTAHINEQYPEYWVNIFHYNGFLPIDCLRTKIWDDKRIEWWYRQNTIFFVKETSLPAFPALNKALSEVGNKVLPLVHPELLEHKSRKVDYYESILLSQKATLKYFIRRLYKKMGG